ncbi:hypothetical protein TNCV_2838241 [Trichonephila clavipes]|nr:hypothetical protein TNCV_2838241 [Trichonephila clavipes]
MEWRTLILSRQGQSRTNAVKAQDYGNSILGRVRCFAGGLYATMNNDQFKCLICNTLRRCSEDHWEKKARHAVKRCFALPL